MRVLINIFVFLLFIQFAIIFFEPVHNSIKYPQEFDEILGRLGGGTHEDTSVIIFTDSHCHWSNQLEDDLKNSNISYFRADTNQSEAARHIHGYLGNNIFGITVSLPTPMSLVGTKIVRGANLTVIQQEIRRVNGAI
jgi:hypothetical protein